MEDYSMDCDSGPVRGAAADPAPTAGRYQALTTCMTFEILGAPINMQVPRCRKRLREAPLRFARGSRASSYRRNWPNGWPRWGRKVLAHMMRWP